MLYRSPPCDLQLTTMSRDLSVAEIKKKLRGYQFQDMTASDAYSLCTNFKTLKPQNMQPFVHSNGIRENCLSLTGTIPVNIRGQQYNIPITLWLRLKHPQLGPLVYVTPTSEMGINQSPFVDRSGMVYLPYLSEWKQGSSDLTTLVQIMCATFVDHCPVFSKAARPTPVPYTQPPTQGTQPTYGQPVGSYRGGGQYPQRPQAQQPYGQQQYTPYPMGSTSAMPSPNPQTNYRPPSTLAGQYYPASGGSSPYPTSTGGYHPQPQPHHPPSTTPQPRQSSPYYHQHPPTSSTVQGNISVATTLSLKQEREKIEETERIKRRSLESTVEDKIRRHVKQVMDAAQDEMSTMLQTQEELQQGSLKINSMLQEMDDKTHELEGSIEFLRSKNVELESMLEYLHAQPDKIDVDDAVSTTSPLYNQILQLYAEENAVDDTIYYLGEALRKDVIEVELFLKHVRELSRQQFMARATIMKARSSAGLPDYSSM